MIPPYKKYLMIVLFVLLVMGVAQEMGFIVPITFGTTEYADLNGEDDAYPRILDDNAPPPVSAYGAGWNSQGEIGSLSGATGGPYWINGDSSANGWSGDQLVGDPPSGLYAEIYRAALLEGSFERNSFNWSKWQAWRNSHHSPLDAPVSDGSHSGYDTPDESLNEVGGTDHDLAAGGESLGNRNDYILDAASIDGSNGGYYTYEPDEPFNAVGGYYRDFSAGGGGVNFWMRNFKSINDLGNSVFDVAKVPEPVTILLLCLGLMGIQGIRRFIK